MRKIILLGIVVIAGYFTFKSFPSSKMSKFFEPHYTISNVRDNPSVFADSLVTLQDVTVENTECLLNYSKSTIIDGSGAEILLISNKPYKKGQKIDIHGRYLQLYQKDEKNCDAFVAEDLRSFNEMVKAICHINSK